jgi:hypothetical protein
MRARAGAGPTLNASFEPASADETAVSISKTGATDGAREPRRHCTVRVADPETWVNTEFTMTFIVAVISAEAWPVPPVTV